MRNTQKRCEKEKKDAENKDWDIIGTAFHKWAREHTGMLGLKKSDDYNRFVAKEMVTFAKAYSLLLKASISFDKEYEYAFYNANREFTFQYQLILAVIDPNYLWMSLSGRSKPFHVSINILPFALTIKRLATMTERTQFSH